MSKVAIKGATTGTGVFTLESPATNTDRTLVLPDEAGTIITTAGVPASAMPAGSVLQVVQITSTTTAATASPTMIATGIGATITPTSVSSKILVMIQTSLSGTTGIGISIARGETIIWNPMVSDENGFYGALYNDSVTRALSNMQYLDSPATTSATTYNLYFAARSVTGTINPNDSTTGGTCIILMEIAG